MTTNFCGLNNYFCNGSFVNMITPAMRKLYYLSRIKQGLASGQPPGEPGDVPSPVPPQTSSSIGNVPGVAGNSMMSQQPRNIRDPMFSNMGGTPVYSPYHQQREHRPGFSSNLYGNYPQKMNQTNVPSQCPPGSYPVLPDVTFKNLPFYDKMGEIIKPTSLMPQLSQRLQDAVFTFHLTPGQANEISLSKDFIISSNKPEHTTQVQLRFCLLETSCEQEDYFPPGVVVKVNGKVCPLPNPIPTNKPNVEPKRPPRPVNLTSLLRISPLVANQINISWAPDYSRAYCFAVFLVRKLNSTQLLQRLKAKGIRHADFTTGLIKEKLNEDADSEIATTSLRVSLVCPLGKMKMTTPCRSICCSHLQCFDASLFLQMNERKPTWVCPVCDKICVFDKLVIDGYFQEVLTSSRLTNDVTEVQLHKDGTWSTSNIKKEASQVLSSPTLAKKNPIPTVIETIPVDADEGSPESDVIFTESSSSTVNPVGSGVNDGVTPLTSSSSSSSSCSSASSTSSTTIVANKEAPKRKMVCIDLTISDSDDDSSSSPTVFKRSYNSTSNVNANITTAIKSDGNSTTTASTYPSRAFSTDSNSNMLATGRSSVSSSGYTSPNIITLDSPSPPPINTTPPPESLPISSSQVTTENNSNDVTTTLTNSQNTTQQMYNNSPMQLSFPTFYDLE